MLDAEPGRRWWPNEHEQARMARMFQDRGHHKSCRHYKKTGERLFFCTKTETDKKTCTGCMTCPNCGGMMYTYRMKKDRNKNHLYITHAKSCTLCGAYIEEEYVVAGQTQPEPRKKDQCQVAECTCIAHEGFLSTELNLTTGSFTICLTHKRRIKTWRLNAGKGIEHIPMIVRDGLLHDNPDYEIKQGKRKP